MTFYIKLILKYLSFGNGKSFILSLIFVLSFHDKNVTIANAFFQFFNKNEYRKDIIYFKKFHSQLIYFNLKQLFWKFLGIHIYL